ncbi:uncharacterized protein AB675_4760 [Cyphellophora attinorum]|uniref:Uncharacterized protein n=1 Tax=Cyphellophora attinorum TaxID=1664694 RepID=A0A0N0NIB9_9EURO|nr:uncharacterized protein AB675_4760 [Phialophora attinorum]KPI35661.1 hypothetical protein AB675_4760 [Phialophora attinorum]
MPFSFSTLHPTLYPNLTHPGTTHSLPLLLLRLEGTTLFLSSIYLYHRLQRWHLASSAYASSPSQPTTLTKSTTATSPSTAPKVSASNPLSWTRFGILLLAPDLGMVGFLRDSRWGSWIYNLVHCEIFPLVLVSTLLSDVLDLRSLTGGEAKRDDDIVAEGSGARVLGLRKGTWAAWMGVGITWLAHIGMDRMIGAGLKYETGFGHTHLGVM